MGAGATFMTVVPKLLMGMQLAQGIGSLFSGLGNRRKKEPEGPTVEEVRNMRYTGGPANFPGPGYRPGISPEHDYFAGETIGPIVTPSTPDPNSREGWFERIRNRRNSMANGGLVTQNFNMGGLAALMQAQPGYTTPQPNPNMPTINDGSGTSGSPMAPDPRTLGGHKPMLPGAQMPIQGGMPMRPPMQPGMPGAPGMPGQPGMPAPYAPRGGPMGMRPQMMPGPQQTRMQQYGVGGLQPQPMRGYAEGGMVQPQGGSGPQEQQLVMLAIAAIQGKVPNPEQILQIFVSRFGQEALLDLIQRVKGQNPGTADNIPANLSEGEYVVPADVVQGMGGGDPNAGAQQLMQMAEMVRQQQR